MTLFRKWIIDLVALFVFGLLLVVIDQGARVAGIQGWPVGALKGAVLVGGMFWVSSITKRRLQASRDASRPAPEA